MTIKRPRLPWLAVPALLIAGGLSLAPSALGVGPAEFGVRSRVIEPAGDADHGRVYAILSVQMFSSDPRNLAVVDEDALMMQVCQALDAQGFRRVVKGQNPEILITVHYGRAWLRNPYLTEKGDNQATDGISSVDRIEKYPNRDVAGSVNRLIDGMSNGYEARVQKAAAEKLYVRLSGWKYPPDPKAKARLLWQTTVVVDDPDRWNLNAVAGGMLTAGAPYFDRAIEEKEIEVHPPVPVGHVNVGTLEVVDARPAKPAPATPTEAAVPPGRDSAVTAKKFDLPAGDAVTTLQLFSRQSGEEIIYPVEQLRGIRTNPVHGEMSARAALDRVLDGTGLSAVQDEKSEALAVRPSPRR